MTTYSTDSDGKFIPASQRPDGTWRKARRVKDGYVPQEEVPLYESKGKQFAARRSDFPVGMCPNVAQGAKEKRAKQHQKQQKKVNVPGVIVLPKTSKETMSKSNQTKQSNKSSTCKEVGKTEPSDKSSSIQEIGETLSDLELNEKQELTKKLKKLKKKIREIEAIEVKINSGELKKPDKDQIDKVKRKKEFLKELQELENEYEN